MVSSSYPIGYNTLTYLFYHKESGASIYEVTKLSCFSCSLFHLVELDVMGYF